ncbi:MAG: TIGR00296 family protein [Candidatus Aenigmatarchaeota archaeon]
MVDAKSGETLVRMARGIVASIAGCGQPMRGPGSVDEAAERSMKRSGVGRLRMRRGVFVTIKKHPEGQLRGCVGFVQPAPLWESVQKAAALAAFGDCRFEPISAGELGDIVFEVSVMTEPVLVEGRSAAEWRKNIRIGRDGLIISNGGYNGLLLPQVPVEQGWDVDEFLENLCYKAGLGLEALSGSDTMLMKFRCQAFAEVEPRGRVVEVKFARRTEPKKLR